MVTRAERGREDFRRFLNFIGPSQAQAQRRSVMTGNPVVQRGLLDPQSVAMQPGVGRGTDAFTSQNIPLYTPPPRFAVNTIPTMPNIGVDVERPRFSFGQGLQNIFNNPTALGNIAAGISLLEGGELTEALGIREALQPTEETTDTALPDYLGKLKEGEEYLQRDDGQYVIRAIRDGSVENEIFEQIRKDKAAIQAVNRNADSYIFDIDTILSLVPSGGFFVGAFALLPGRVKDAIGRLRNKEFINNLKDLKAGGATLGQVTETEGARLEQLATSLNPFSPNFIPELERLRDKTLKIRSENIDSLNSAITQESGRLHDDRVALAVTEQDDTDVDKELGIS